MPWKCERQGVFDILACKEIERNLAAGTASLELQLDLKEGVPGEQ
jgi:hypothetical protein